jgi:hypothetical protein
MTSKQRTAGVAAILAGASLTAAIAANDAKTVASGRSEILLETTQSWNGKPYTHYPTGQPQLTTIKLPLRRTLLYLGTRIPSPMWSTCFQALSRCETEPAARLRWFIRDRPLESQLTISIGVSQATNPLSC